MKDIRRQSIPNDDTLDIIYKIRVIAMRLGWAIGVHGTLERDIDLMGIPWTSNAASGPDLYQALLTELEMTGMGIEHKPYGRVGFILIRKDAIVINDDYLHAIWSPPCIDLSLANTGKCDDPNPSSTTVKGTR